jgi:hypothetical protein
MLKETKKYIELKKEEQRIKDSRLKFKEDVLRNSSYDDPMFNFMFMLNTCLSVLSFPLFLWAENESAMFFPMFILIIIFSIQLVTNFVSYVEEHNLRKKISIISLGTFFLGIVFFVYGSEYFIARYSSGAEGFFFWINVAYLFMIFPFIFKNTLLFDYIKSNFFRKRFKDESLIKNEINNLKNIISKEKELQIDSLENHYESPYLKELNEEIFTIEYIREILIEEKNGVKDKKIQIETS